MATRSTQTPSVLQACPDGQGEVAEQAARHCWLTHTRPAPHCALKRQVSELRVQRPPTQVCPEAHWVLSVQGQLDVVGLQALRVQTPSEHVTPVGQSALVRQVPGVGAGTGSVGVRH